LLCFIFRPVVPNSPFFLTKNLVWLAACIRPIQAYGM
jgi:hypothetical protein